MRGKPKHPYALFVGPFGRLGLSWQGEALVAIDLEPGLFQPTDLDEPPANIIRQLANYFADPRAPFDLPLCLEGTPFQQRVWTLLRTIPPGETRTYGELASVLGSSARAVGQACRANPCPIVIPCHRVVGRSGLVGFAGAQGGRSLEIKRWLLAHEGILHLSTTR